MIIRNGQIITPNGIIPKGYVIASDGIICSVGEGEIDSSCDENCIDAKGMFVSPGFIDMHTHGAGGYDFMDCSVEACRGISAEHAKHGSTLIFPTTLASDNAELFSFLEVYDKVKDSVEGAAFGGLHLEGPYFAYAFRGAQDPKYLKNPDPRDYIPVLERCSDIRRWSIAPELPGALEFGRLIAERGILPSIAHTDAIYEDVVKAYDAGFTLITHFYSCMNGITRRNAYRYAGCIEAGYLIDGLKLEIIGDGIHVPKPLLQLVLKIKGVEGVALCTDSMRGAGMPDGESILGSLSKGQKVIIEDGVAKMPDRSCFAGSVATTDRLVRTAHKIAGCPIEDAVRMVSRNPAEIMGVGERKGKIEAGYDADIAIFDSEINVFRTIVGGKTVYNKSNPQQI